MPLLNGLNKIIHACYQHQTEQTPTQSWVRAFGETERWWPIVLQHLLMGILIWTWALLLQKQCRLKSYPIWGGDFDKTNQVLASLVGDVQKELTEIWLLLGLLNRYLGSVEKSIINFSMEKARDAAWSFAETLSPQPAEQRQQQIVYKDKMIALFSNVVSRPGFPVSLTTKIIRLGERGSTRQIIEILT